MRTMRSTYEHVPDADAPHESDCVSSAVGSPAATLSPADSAGATSAAVQRSSTRLAGIYDADGKLGDSTRDSPRSDPSRMFYLSKRHADRLKSLFEHQHEPEAASQDHLPPGWFLSKAAWARYQQLNWRFKTSGVLPSGDELKDDTTVIPTGPARAERDSIFLSSPLLQQLDRPMVYVPVYCCLAMMAGIGPALSYTLIPRTDLPGRLPIVNLHVASLALLWLSYLEVFHNLRRVVRPRSSRGVSRWLKELAHELLMEKKSVDAATDTDELIARITTHLRERGAEVWAEKTQGAATLQKRWRMHARRKTMLRRGIVLYSDSTGLRLLLRAFKRWMGYTMRVKQLRHRPAISVADEKGLALMEQLQLQIDTYGERTALHLVRLLNDQDYQLPRESDTSESPLPSTNDPKAIDFERIDLKKLQLSDERRVFGGFSSVEEYIYLCLRGQIEARPPFRRLGIPLPSRNAGFAVQYPLARLRWSSYTRDSMRSRSFVREQLHQLTTIHEDDYQQLQRTVWFVYALAACMVLGVLVYAKLFWIDNVRDLDDKSALNYRTLLALLIVLVVPASLIGAAIFAAWFLTLLLGVRLATDAINDLRNNAELWKPSTSILRHMHNKDSWHNTVQRPALELVHSTLPSLCAWAPAIGTIFVCFWVFALAGIPLATAKMRSEDEQYVGAWLLVFITFVSAVPVMLLYAPASVSTATDRLLNELNELRVRVEGTDEVSWHRMVRAGQLISYLDRVNNSRGPGFVMFGVVVDLRFLVNASISAGTILSSVVLFLMHQVDQDDEPLGSSAGGL